MKSTWLLPALAVVALSAGCAAKSKTLGVREPDLARIKPTVSRSEVEKTLEHPRWRAGSADGLSYDIYEYKSAQPPQRLAGVVTLGFDLFTLGLVEYNLADMVKNGPASQVAVAYDGDDRVRFVSRPWPVGPDTVGPCRSSRGLLPSDSGVPSTAHPSPQPGRASSVATLRVGRRPQVTLDVRKVDRHVVELPPGPYAMNCDVRTERCVLCDASSLFSCNAGYANTELLAGRVYRLRRTRLYFGFEREDILWLEDADSRETVRCIASPRF